MIVLLVSILFVAGTGGILLSRIENKSNIAFVAYCAIYGLILLESICLLTLRASTGEWLFTILPNPNHGVFQAHPYLVGTIQPNSQIKVGKLKFSHNSSGFRSAAIDPVKSRIRVAAIGGSTTYGVGVDDSETWPAVLQKKLGNKYEVINMGVPGHSSVEHQHFVSFILPQYQPDIILLHVGLNDMHVGHTPNLEPDYANFHAPILASSLGLCMSDRLPKIAILRVAVILLQKADWYPSCYKKNESARFAGVDSYAIELYGRNLKNLFILSREISKNVIAIPQILVPDAVGTGEYDWWTPHLKQSSLTDQMQAYNEKTATISKASGVKFLSEIERQTWSKQDFADQSHLDKDANEKFAEIVFKAVSPPSG